MNKWMTWELFEWLYDCSARDYPERCDYDKMLIYTGGLR
jgi:hypothetical protein